MPKLINYGLLLSYIYGGILCADEKYRENRRLSVFDSPHFLASVYTKELLIHQNLKIHRNYIKLLLQQIKAGCSEGQISGNGCCHDSSRINLMRFQTILEAVDCRLLRIANFINSWTKYTAFHTLRELVDTINFFELDSPENAFRGCLLGLLVIQDTYDVNIEPFSKGGVPLNYIAVKDDNCQIDEVCMLDASDLLALASHALKINWYESAIRFANYSEHHAALQENRRQYTPDIQELIYYVKTKSYQKLSYFGTSKLSIKDMEYLPFSSKHVFYQNVR